MLEIACFTLPSAIAAVRSGADRIELCADYTAGGLTPSIASVRSIRLQATIPINVMIRPRGGDFHYSEAEFKQMKDDLRLFRDSADGFVFGILDTNGHVDQARNCELVELADPSPCTFHRAIDQVDDLDEATEEVLGCGFKSILTSGGTATAAEGAQRVADLQKRYGEKVTFVLGGGIRSDNVQELKRSTGVEWIHSAAITRPGEEVDAREVKKMLEALGSID